MDIDRPVHIIGSTIDLVFIKVLAKKVTIEVVPFFLSDHYLIYFRIEGEKLSHSSKIQKCPFFSNPVAVLKIFLSFSLP